MLIVQSRCGLAVAFALVLALSDALAAPAAAADARVATIQSIVKSAIAKQHLEAVIVKVRSNGSSVYTGTFGESMTGVPATPDMHFRNGALAFTYMSTLLLEFVDQKRVTLDTRLSKYFPDLPDANRITLRELAQMTSGYADYVYQPEVTNGVYLNPFRQWTPQELIHIGVSKPMEFTPGANWGYSHTNYVILGLVLQKIAGMPLAEALQRSVLGPMGLKQTTQFTTPVVPGPVLHSFSSERREVLQLKPSVPFYEESTFWNPSWTTVEGAVETTDITDLCISLEAVGTGKLLSKSSSLAQIKPSLIGFGHTQAKCAECRANTVAFNYGLGVILYGPWITQTLGFAGASGAVGYLPSRRLTIAVEATNGAGAYDSHGNSGLGAATLFRDLASALAPGTLPKEPR